MGGHETAAFSASTWGEHPIVAVLHPGMGAHMFFPPTLPKPAVYESPAGITQMSQLQETITSL